MAGSRASGPVWLLHFLDVPATELADRQDYYYPSEEGENCVKGYYIH